MARWGCMYPGLYVLCFYDTEWHRAIVTSIQEEEKEFITVRVVNFYNNENPYYPIFKVYTSTTTF